MRKSKVLFVLSLTTILLACNPWSSNSNQNDLAGSLQGIEMIEVILPNESEPITTISEKQDIVNFIDSLKIDTWIAQEVPPNAIQGKIYKLYKQDTIKYGQSRDEQELKEVASITVYNNEPYLEFNLKNFSFHFLIPNDVFISVHTDHKGM